MKKSNRPAIELTQSELDVKAIKYATRKAESEGWNAWMHSQGQSVNPYEVGSEHYDSFLRGYSNAENQYGAMRSITKALHNLSNGEIKSTFKPEGKKSRVKVTKSEAVVIPGEAGLKKRGRPAGSKNKPK